ncbi:MAG: aminoglycoside 6-adenylyltransferase [Actinobacteria bacterium]|nr:aminoglycoside 6-adenylyltransferase [Actinomycetota bacterium]
MDAAAYLDYLERLVADLGEDPRVRGVLAFGSTAATTHEPDRWSDHDLGLVVEQGSEEAFRTDPSWLPDHGRLLLWMREDRRSVKGVFDDGHQVEAAVIPPEDLARVPLGAVRVLLDKGGVAAALRQPGRPDPADARRPESHLVGQFVTALLVGLGRYARGEVLSGEQFVKVHAAGHLLALLPAVAPPEDPEAPDPADPWRRVERAYPEIAAEVAAALDADVPRAALGLLAAAEASVMPAVGAWPSGVAAIVRRRATGLLAARQTRRR